MIASRAFPIRFKGLIHFLLPPGTDSSLIFVPAYRTWIFGVVKSQMVTLCIQIDCDISNIGMNSQSSNPAHPKGSCSNLPILLIYYNFKGIGQMIRYLLCYLEIPFIDIFLDEYDKQKLTLPNEVLQALKSKCINRCNLPAIIHNSEIVCDLNQITNYICLTFQREDLLGVDLYKKVQVCEIQQIYSTRLNWAIRYFSKFIGEFNKITEGEKLLPFVQQNLEYLFRQSGYFNELSTYLMKQKDQKFILSNLTVIDFYFIESSRVIVALYGCIDEQLASDHWVADAQKYRKSKQAKGETIKYIENLRAMRKFIYFFTSQPFYNKNQQYLQSFHHTPLLISREQDEGMKKLCAKHSMDLYYDIQE